MKNKKINVAVVGASGRMGIEIGKVLQSHSYMRPALAIVGSKENNIFEKNLNKMNKKDFAKIQIVIDFSTAENFVNTIRFCVENSLPLVSGVTGITEKQKKELDKAAKKIPILWSPNMSIGIATLKKALLALSAIKNFDFQILEFHHNRKKDNPGGTALMLQEQLELVIKKKTPAAIGVRGGGIFGVHQVFAMSEEEVLTFEHNVLSRSVFAKGAVQAAEWLVQQKTGLYSMDHVVG